MNDPYITVQGYVGSDVVLNTTKQGAQVTNFRLACTPRRLVDGTWQDQDTLWFTVKAWRQLADNVVRSVRRGQPVLVTGRLVADTYEKDGQVHTRFEIVATSVGHDLGRGTTSFHKPDKEPPEVEAAPAADVPAGSSSAGGSDEDWAPPLAPRETTAA